MNTINDFIKEAQGYLFQLDDVSSALTEAIQDCTTWTQNVRVAQDNYDKLEAAFIFDLVTGSSLAATGKNAEQRSAAKDAELMKFRDDTQEWKVLQDTKEMLAEYQSVVRQNEKKLGAIKVQAKLVSSIIKALSGQA
jgi:hypothetical protein